MANVSNLNNGTTSYTVRDAQAEALLVDNASKNLLKLSVKSQTMAGLTLSVDDGTIRINGTASNTLLLMISDISNLELNKNYIFTGCDGGAVDTYRLDIRPIDASSYDYILIDGSIDIVHRQNYNAVFLRVEQGLTLNNVSLRPMIRKAEITDSTFEPYYRTQKQLDADLSTVETYTNTIKNNITVGKPYVFSPMSQATIQDESVVINATNTNGNINCTAKNQINLTGSKGVTVYSGSDISSNIQLYTNYTLKPKITLDSRGIEIYGGTGTDIPSAVKIRASNNNVSSSSNSISLYANGGFVGLNNGTNSIAVDIEGAKINADEIYVKFSGMSSQITLKEYIELVVNQAISAGFFPGASTIMYPTVEEEIEKPDVGN